MPSCQNQLGAGCVGSPQVQDVRRAQSVLSNACSDVFYSTLFFRFYLESCKSERPVQAVNEIRRAATGKPGSLLPARGMSADLG